MLGWRVGPVVFITLSLQLQDVLSWMQPGVSITSSFCLGSMAWTWGSPLPGTRTMWEN